ncbi:MAG: heme exporter protein CcmD [Gammaproteobacteria bacterium]|nr:heme exporter protein CcmD [Gammaproteobacteria bacterium]
MIFQFHSWQQFLQMGGYASFVWPAYGIILVALIIYGIKAVVRLRRLLKELKASHADSSST